MKILEPFQRALGLPDAGGHLSSDANAILKPNTPRDIERKTLQRAKNFSWEGAATKMLKIYRNLVQQSKRNASSDYSNQQNHA